MRGAIVGVCEGAGGGGVDVGVGVDLAVGDAARVVADAGASISRDSSLAWHEIRKMVAMGMKILESWRLGGRCFTGLSICLAYASEQSIEKRTPRDIP